MLRITEAMSKYHSETGKKYTIQELAIEVWPETADPISARIKLSRIINNKTKYVEVDVIRKICKLLHVDVNYLFGHE